MGPSSAEAYDELCFTPAVELTAAIRGKDLSPVELMEAILDRIDRVNPKLNAFVTLLGDQALEGAQRAEQELVDKPLEELGPLHGMPITVKDLSPTAGVRTTFGSLLYEDYVPDEDAMIWARLKAAGGILVGKTTTPEMGMHSVTESPLTGITNNPWDTTRTTGGSSGGAAAAVAAGMGPLATGSDGGGSIRVPSSICGTVGLKASIGRIPENSEISPWETVSVVGPITRTVADNALMLNSIAGPSPDVPFSLLETGFDFLADLDGANVDGLRIALSPDLGYPGIEPEVAEGLTQAAEVFETDLGAKVESIELNLPDPFEYFVKYWGPSGYAYVLELEAEGKDLTKCHPIVREYIKRAKDMTAAEHYITAMATRTELHQEFANVFKDYDLLIFPTTAMVAYPHPGELGGPAEVGGRKSVRATLENQRLTEAIAHAMYPAISIPCGFTDEGLPIGLQIAAGHGEDAAVLRAAAAFESARPWADRRPEL